MSPSKKRDEILNSFPQIIPSVTDMSQQETKLHLMRLLFLFNEFLGTLHILHIFV